jgi:peptidoglycan glycosyltransferase
LALALLTATCGYWSIIQADRLRARDDNPRRVLYEQRIVRGRVLDRDGVTLADVDIANDGTVTRRYPVPEAAPAVGYASLRHGTGGIEAAFDPQLRGETGRNDWRVAWEELLHRPPHGHDVQLTLDATLQAQAQRALDDEAGAVVLLNAASGELLALASSPTFDPERLDEEWEERREDPAAPLVNRATQGLYQPGSALQTVVIAEALTQGLAELSAPTSRGEATLSVNGTVIGCSAIATDPRTLADAYAAACPAPFADLGERLGSAGLEEAIRGWALATNPPPLEIPTEAADWSAEGLTGTAALRAEGIGQGSLTVSPLQMALMAGTLANRGKMVTPRLVLRVQDANGGWREQVSAGEPRDVLPPSDARALLAAWQRYGETVAAHWGVAVAGENRPPHVWFMGVAPRTGTTGETRYAIAVLIEHAAAPEAAVRIGTALLEAAAAR